MYYGAAFVKGAWGLCLLASLWSLLVFSLQAQAEPAFVGSGDCRTCHQEAYNLWRESDHYRAMAVAEPGNVLGDFADVRVAFHGITSRFYQTDGKYFVETLGAAGQAQFEISYTFGHYPLQQYLVAMADGRLQVLNTAWDSRPLDEGGQRWFHLQPDESADSPFFWTRHLQNWNSRCADCHSTNLVKGYDPETHRYTTSFSEPNVACEACHGPGSEHIAAARAGQNAPGEIAGAGNTMAWRFKPGAAIAVGTGEISASQIDMCGGCHSRRAVVAATGAYADRYQLALLEAGLYHADGQIEDEVFVLGSYLQSKMHAAGVTCSNCHEPHSGKLVLAGNNLCAQCHRPEVFATTEHHLHPVGSAGGQCVACHMPATTYMLTDDRRDHRFGIPDPALTLESGVPNACGDCHAEQSPGWAVAALGQAAGSADVYARLNRRLQAHDALSAPEAMSFVRDPANPAIKRATILALMANLPPGSLAAEAVARLAREMAGSDEPLIRAALIRSLGAAAPATRIAIIKKLATDPFKTVRIEAGRLFSELLPEEKLLVEEPLAEGGEAALSVLSKTALSVPSKTALSVPSKTATGVELVNEYRASLELAADTPSGQTALGLLELNLGQSRQAFAAYQQALAIEPDYVPALLNLADLHRASNEEAQAAALLQRAVSFAPEAGAANFSYGLSLIRQKRLAEALGYLETASHGPDSQPRYAYVYAVALDAGARTATALQVLRAASVRWPAQYDLLTLEVLYLEKTQRFDELATPLAELVKLAPASPAVRAWVRKYGRSE